MGLGCRVWGLSFGVDLGFMGLGVFRVPGVLGLGFRVCRAYRAYFLGFGGVRVPGFLCSRCSMGWRLGGLGFCFRGGGGGVTQPKSGA